MERIYIMLQPDALQRGIAGVIIARIERKDYRITRENHAADRGYPARTLRTYRGQAVFPAHGQVYDKRSGTR